MTNESATDGEKYMIMHTYLPKSQKMYLYRNSGLKIGGHCFVFQPEVQMNQISIYNNNIIYSQFIYFKYFSKLELRRTVDTHRERFLLSKIKRWEF